MKPPLGFEQKGTVSPNGWSYTLFARDPQDTIREQISLRKLFKLLTRPYQEPVYTHSMNSALGHGAFEASESQVKQRNKSEVFRKVENERDQNRLSFFFVQIFS